MTIVTNNNKLDTHPIPGLVCSYFKVKDNRAPNEAAVRRALWRNNRENNRTLSRTDLVCKAWHDNRAMIQARMAAAVSMSLYRHQINISWVHEELVSLGRNLGSIPAALTMMSRTRRAIETGLLKLENEETKHPG